MMRRWSTCYSSLLTAGLMLALTNVPVLGAKLDVDTGVAFSTLDGGPEDEDGTPDGVLTLSKLTVKEDGVIVIDVPNARFVVAGDVELKDRGAIRASDPSSMGPTLIIETGHKLKLKDDAVIDVSGAGRGGLLFVDAAKDIELKGQAAVMTSGVGANSEGGSVEFRAGHKIDVKDDALVNAGGEILGGVILFSSLKNLTLSKRASVAAAGLGPNGEGGYVELQSGQKVELKEDSSIVVDGDSLGGAVFVCAFQGLKVMKQSVITASGLDLNSLGGDIFLRSGNELKLEGQDVRIRANGGTGGAVTLISCSDKSDAIKIKEGKVEAIGSQGSGSGVELESRQGGIRFEGDGDLIVASGSIVLRAATVVNPNPPPTQPAALVITGADSPDSCDCPMLEGQLTISIDSPENGLFLPDPSVHVTGRVSGATRVTVNGADATLVGGLFSADVVLAQGANEIVAIAEDDAGSVVSDRVIVLRGVPSPVLDPHPALTNTSPFNFTGKADGAAFVEVSGPEGILTVPVTNGMFSVNVPLGINRVNRLFFTAILDTEARSAPTSTAITVDLQPPNLFIDFPSDQAELTNEAADVGGRVGDSLSGFMGLNVNVNGVTAIVDVGIGPNGTFFAEAIPLAVGPNTITATATDELGNTVTRQVTVTRVEILPGEPRVTVLSGNVQTGQVLTVLSEPIVVRVTQGDGTPFTNKIVTFDVTRSDGRLADTPTGDGAMMFQVRTDGNGEARAFWRLGTDAGCGNNRVDVISRDIAGTILFCASATPRPAGQVNISTGNNQRAEIGGPAPEPLRVWVSDTYNGVAGVPVTFTVRRGGGKVEGGDSATVVTGVTGHAEVSFMLGPETGTQEVAADFPGNTGGTAFFTIRGLVRDESMPTRFEGVVLDNAGRPIEGATCSLVVGAGPSLVTLSDAFGRFRFDNLTDTGPGHLHIDGLTATAVDSRPIPPGSFPALAYEVVVIPNAVNTLPTPVPLPPLNPNNAVLFDNTQDVELTVEGMDGLKMVVRAGSMTRADGSVPSPSDPAVIALNQVHFDDVPMPMPDGAAPPFAWTLQPAGALFNPPVEIVYPNMSSLPPGSIAFFLSFNHDLGRFEIVATGQVTEDGASIVSDPGSGISVAGWGCNCPPYSVTGDCLDCGPCETEVNGECVETEPCCDGVPYDPATEGCCDDTVYDLATQGCCEIGVGPFSNDTVYDLETQCCEDPNIGRNQVVNKNPITAGVILLGMCDGRVQNPNWVFQFDGCSLPFSPGFDKDNPAGGADTHFGGIGNGPCDNHDRCYQTCSADDGARLACDQAMLNDMRAVCNASAEPQDVVESCLSWANTYFRGLRAGGKLAFDGRQREVCNCCP